MNFKISRPDRGRSGRLQPASRAGGRAWRRRFYPALPQGIAVDQVGKGVIRVHPCLPDAGCGAGGVAVAAHQRPGKGHAPLQAVDNARHWGRRRQAGRTGAPKDLGPLRILLGIGRHDEGFAGKEVGRRGQRIAGAVHIAVGHRQADKVMGQVARLPVAALRCLLLGSRQGAPLQKDIGLGEDASRLPCAGGCGIRWRRGVIENAHRAGRFDQAVPIAVPGREPGRGQRQDFIQIGQGQTAAGIPFERTGNAPVTLRTRQVYAERCNACSCLGDLRI